MPVAHVKIQSAVDSNQLISLCHSHGIRDDRDQSLHYDAVCVFFGKSRLWDTDKRIAYTHPDDLGAMPRITVNQLAVELSKGI